jgi:hypothetical protein
MMMVVVVVVVVVVARNSSEGLDTPSIGHPHICTPRPFQTWLLGTAGTCPAGLCPSREDAVLGTCGGVPGEPCERAPQAHHLQVSYAHVH